MTGSGRRFLAALAVAGVVLSCAARAHAAPPNIVVFLVDTLRADRLGAYGAAHRLTPFLDALAARGTIFERTYAQSSWTEPSVASLFTSRFQSQHGVVDFASGLDAHEVTIAEVLRANGYATGAFLATSVLRETDYGRGFDAYRVFGLDGDPGARRKARGRDVGAAALEWVDGLPSGRPFFLYLHYLEPHIPYAPPDAALARVRGDLGLPDVGAANDTMFFASARVPDARALRNLAVVYDAEVASVDDAIRETFTALGARHRLDGDAVVIVTADHGEALGDHGLLGHGESLYEELIHVPLLVVLPGSLAHATVDAPVSLIDVAPTLVDMAGAASPPAFEGRSLRPQVAGAGSSAPPPGAPRPVLSELIRAPEKARRTPHLRAVIVGRRKLVVRVDGTRAWFDLVRDPGERTPLTSVEPELLAAEREFAGRVPVLATTSRGTVPPEHRKQLDALGYVE